MVADDVDDRAPGPSGVVQVGQAVAQPRAEVEQSGRRPAGHPGKAVGRAGGDTLEGGQDTVHVGDPVEGSDEVHLGGARVHEAVVDPVRHERTDERLGAVHCPTSFRGPDGASTSKMVPGLRRP